jgi:4-hydroxy-4-methyl-2-oxoglutarate aldolase
MTDTLDISVEAFASKIKKLSAAVLWDRSYGSAVIVKENLINYNPGAMLAGPAFLVNVENSILPIIQALDVIPEHHVLVVNDLSDKGDALLGDIIMAAAHSQRVAGILAFGIIRDVASAPKIGIPVWAKGTTVKAATLGAPTDIFPEAIDVGAVTIRAGDWIVGDSDDLLVIDQEKIRFVIKSAELKNKKENRYIANLNEGKRISEMMNLHQYLRGEGELIIEF